MNWLSQSSVHSHETYWYFSWESQINSDWGGINTNVTLLQSVFESILWIYKQDIFRLGWSSQMFISFWRSSMMAHACTVKVTAVPTHLTCDPVQVSLALRGESSSTVIKCQIKKTFITYSHIPTTTQSHRSTSTCLTHWGPSPPSWGPPAPGGPSSPHSWSQRWSGRGTRRSSDAHRRSWSWSPHLRLLAGTGGGLWMLRRETNKRNNILCNMSPFYHLKRLSTCQKTWNQTFQCNHTCGNLLWGQYAQVDNIQYQLREECGHMLLLYILSDRTDQYYTRPIICIPLTYRTCIE